VLLIPLQAGTVVRGLGNANLVQSRQLRQVNQTLAALREKIQSAPDLASLQSRIPVDLASTVGPVALQQPLIFTHYLTLAADQARPAGAGLSPCLRRCLCRDERSSRGRVIAAGSLAALVEPLAHSQRPPGAGQHIQCGVHPPAGGRGGLSPAGFRSTPVPRQSG